MLHSRPVPPPNQWILIPRPDWHFPSFIPPHIGPKLPLPLRPRVLPYRLRLQQANGIKPRTEALRRVSNPLVTQLFNKYPILDRIFTKRAANMQVGKPYQSSRVLPYRLKPPKMKNEFWKRGYKMPMPSQYAIGCRRPTKLFDLPTQEFHFRVVHPQFGKFFDKWSQKDINWDDLRNHTLMERDLQLLVSQTHTNQRRTSNRITKLHRPNPFTAYIERALLMAYMNEKKLLSRINFKKDPKEAERFFEQSENRLSHQIIEMYKKALEDLQERETQQRIAKLNTKRKDI